MMCYFCSTRPIDPTHDPYCGVECAIDAEVDSDLTVNRMQDVPALRQMVRRCWPKAQCDTKGAAEAQMRSLLKRGLEKNAATVHVYECPHCRYWHVGHTSC